LIQIKGDAPARRFDGRVTNEARPAMPTIDIVILALVVGGALAFMAEMVWFSMDRNKLSHDD
jgi:hypothetical protein